MEEQPDFTTLLRSFMARAVRSNRDLARLTGIAFPTIENWTAGKVRRPRFVQDVLRLAHALALNEIDTTALLLAAGHQPLAQLQANTAHLGDPQLVALLRIWVQADGSSDPPSTTEAVSRPRLVPYHQLRSPVADFVGRDQEVERLVHTLRSAVATGRGAVISGVLGMGGIGKTELAYTVAHRLHNLFPDAQIVLNLRGTSSAPLTPAQVLQAVIHTFAPDNQLPEDLDVLQQYYQSALHGKRVLLLADDARDATQVRPLLPPTSCALLITSRTRLTLPGMITIELEQLPAEAASSLLRTICPRLSEAEAQAIAQTCGYLPLALRISASLLRSTPAWAVADYLSQLVNEQQRLALLRDPDEPQHDVAAALALSYAQLDASSQAVFRQLGVFVADFATDLALAVVQAPADVAVEATLRLLLRRNLVLYDGVRGRWRLHDLIRDLARQRLEELGEMETAQWRYARAAVQTAQDIQDQYLAGGEQTLAALTRFDAERAHIDATRHWAHHHAQMSDGDQLLLDIALATRCIGELRYDGYHERIPLWEGARTAAQRLGNLLEEALALNYLGNVYYSLGEPSRAISYYEQSFSISRNDRRSEGGVLGNLGLAYAHLGELHTAISYYEQQLTISRELHDRHLESMALGNLGNAYNSLDKPSKAISYYEQQLIIVREIGDRRGEGASLTNLADTYIDIGNIRRAIECCETALTIVRAIGSRRFEGYVLSYLAPAQALKGNIAQATTTFAQGLTLLQEVGDRWGEAEGRWLFGLALIQQGEREHTLPLLHTAVAYEQEIGHEKVAEHASLIVRLEAGEPLPVELRVPTDQQAIGDDTGGSAHNDTEP